MKEGKSSKEQAESGGIAMGDGDDKQEVSQGDIHLSVHEEDEDAANSGLVQGSATMQSKGSMNQDFRAIEVANN